MSSGIRVEVRPSGIWQTNSVVVASGGEALVVDPAFFPRELDELADLVRGLGVEPAAVTVAFTHAHWDHVAGWRHFPGARTRASASLARAVAGDEALARHCLEELRDFDGRWYVPRLMPTAWPPDLAGLEDGERLRIGAVVVEALSLPGHSADGLGLLLPEPGLLLPGDHLSPCEIPFVEDLPAYRSTLSRLRSTLARADRVVPGHGPALDRAGAAAVLEADSLYLEALADCAARGDVAGALALPLPRAADVPGMAEKHRENCVAAGLSLPPV